MYLPQRFYQPLAQLDDAPWQKLLQRHRFWKERHTSCDAEHQALAFHILMHDGELGLDMSAKTPSSFEFDAVTIPPASFEDEELCAQTLRWSAMHEANFGAGQTVKMGLYVIAAGGLLGYHVDGPVFLKGQRADLANRDIQRGIVEVHASRRTILPLHFNPQDQFLICGHPVPLQGGQLFEFSNVLPHSYVNKGEHDAVLLVTTYLVEELLPEEFSYA